TNLTNCDLEEIAKNCPEEVDINSFYETYQKSGINYGSNFRLIHQLKRGENTAFAQIKLTDRLEREKYHFHPAMLDACFQGIAAILFKEESSVTYVPVRLGKLAFFHPPDEQVISAVRLKNSSPNPNIIIADIDIYSPQGQPLASLTNLELKAVQSQEIIPQEIPPQIYLEEWMPCEELLGNGRDTLVAPQVIKNQSHPAQLEQQLGEKLAQYERLMASLEKLSVVYIWEAFHRSHPGQKISLPNSPFIRKRYWINSGNKSESSNYKNPNYYSGHPLLGDHFPSPLALLQYRGSISQHKPAFLGEHQVFDQAILPASALIEMALAAGENQKVILENVEFKKALILKDTEDTLQLIIEQKSFKIYHALEPNWEVLVTGKIEELKSTNL
ncbi:MAG: polyketide synthase dehydratase domain-containing protein, partial [Microcystis sp.]